MNTRKQNIEIIESACVAANPEIHQEDRVWNGFEEQKCIRRRPIQLTDVLLVMPHMAFGWSHFSNSYKFYNANNSSSVKWNLLKPLHDQSDETLQFIAGLLAA